MGDYLFAVGNVVKVQQRDNKSHKMLIIGTCIKDTEGNMHDYAGVPYPTGYSEKIACFEHRELIAKAEGDD